MTNSMIAYKCFCVQHTVIWNFSYFSESEDLVRNLVEELLKNVNADLMRKSTEDMVDSILKRIIKCVSIHGMVNEIIDNLPVKDLSEEQLSSVEETASKLMCLQEPQVPCITTIVSHLTIIFL